MVRLSEAYADPQPAPSPLVGVVAQVGGRRVNDLVLRGVLPGEFSLGWVARGCEGCGGGGKPERDEQAVRFTGVGDERDDPTATAARANQNVLGEHPAQQVSPRQPAGTRRDGVRGTWAGSMVVSA